MTHLSPANAVRPVLPTVSDADSSVTPLIGNHQSLEDALIGKRAQIAQLEIGLGRRGRGRNRPAS